MLIQCPKVVLDCVQTLQKHNFEAYLVGGAVRDALMHRQTLDWDIATNAKSNDIHRLFKNAYSLNPKFGTWCLKKAGLSIEITSYRTEHAYLDHRHPSSVEFCDDLFEDLKRRDFTINAIAYDPVLNVIKDPFGGQKDILQQRIQTVGLAMDRLNEDYLRMIRAARFSATLGFTISQDIIQATQYLSQHLHRISSQRIGQEFFKLFSAKSSYSGIEFCIKTQISDSLFNKSFDHIEFLKIELHAPYKEVLKLIKLFKFDWESVLSLIKQWAWPKNEKLYLNQLKLSVALYEKSKIQEHCMHDFFLTLAPLSLKDWQTTYEYLYETNEKQFIAQLSRFKKNTVLIDLKDLAVSGHDIKEKIQNLEDYPYIKNILNDLLTQVRKNKLENCREALLNYVSKQYAQIVQPSSIK